jgi:hypothetical protein
MNVDYTFHAASKLKFNNLIEFKSYYISYSLLRLICESNIDALAEPQKKKLFSSNCSIVFTKKIFYYLQRVLIINI